MAKLEQTIRKIQDILKRDTRGLTIQEIAEQTRVSRITAAKALLKLEGAQQIDVRIIGNCRLHYLKQKKWQS